MIYRVDLGINNMEKKGENTHSGHFRVMCTGTPECVPVHPSRTQCVPVHVRGVSVHLVMLFLF